VEVALIRKVHSGQVLQLRYLALVEFVLKGLIR